MAPAKHSADRTWSCHFPLSLQFAGKAAEAQRGEVTNSGSPSVGAEPELSAAQFERSSVSPRPLASTTRECTRGLPAPASRAHRCGCSPVPALSSFSPHVTSCRGASLPSRPSFSLVILLTEQNTHSKLNGPYLQSR